MAQHHEVPEVRRPYRPVQTGARIEPPMPSVPPPARRVRARSDLCSGCYAVGRCLRDRLCWDAERAAIAEERSRRG